MGWGAGEWEWNVIHTSLSFGTPSEHDLKDLFFNILPKQNYSLTSTKLQNLQIEGKQAYFQLRIACLYQTRNHN